MDQGAAEANRHCAASVDPAGLTPRFTLEPNTLLFPPRHGAEVLTAVRIHSREPGIATAVTRLPMAEHASLGQLGVLADVAAGQAVVDKVPEGHGIRTLGLHLHLAGNLVPGSTVRAWGQTLNYDQNTGLTSATMCDEDGCLVATTTGRFMVVPDQLRSTGDVATELLGDLAVPEPWDWALGIQDLARTDEGVAITGMPHESSRNRAPMMHGGLQVRALELALETAVAPSPGEQGWRLADLDVFYHRPVPVDGHSTLVVRARVIRQGQRASVAAGTLETTEGRLLTGAQATFLRQSNR